MNALRFILCSGILLLGSNVSHAGFTFLGPTPYLSAADSPFNLSGLGTTFFLEDFEDADYVPGVPQLEDGFELTQPGSSVDIDDGVIDGSGTGGSSFAENDGIDGAFTTLIVRFEFDELKLGFLPNAVGLVLTSGGGQASNFIVDAADGASMTINTEALNISSSTPSDDLFFGFTNPVGITSIVYYKTLFPFVGVQPLPRVDHLQFGLLVPEPSSGLLLISIGGWLITGKRIRFSFVESDSNFSYNAT